MRTFLALSGTGENLFRLQSSLKEQCQKVFSGSSGDFRHLSIRARAWDYVVCRPGMFHSGFPMDKTIQWPRGEFTIQEALDLNPAWPQAAVRKKLADDMAAKTIVQTQKGNDKVKGKFQLAKAAATAG